MKIRNGFVSNSSTSSFCIFGARLEESEIKELLKLTDDDYVSEKLEDLFKDECLEVHTAGDYDPDGIYVGRGLGSIRDDETGKEFRESVNAILKKYFNKDYKCEIHDVAYYS